MQFNLMLRTGGLAKIEEKEGYGSIILTPRRSIDNPLFPDHSNGSFFAGVTLPRVRRTWAWNDLLVAFCEDREQADKQDHTLLFNEPLDLGCFQSGS